MEPSPRPPAVSASVVDPGDAATLRCAVVEALATTHAAVVGAACQGDMATTHSTLAAALAVVCADVAGATTIVVAATAAGLPPTAIGSSSDRHGRNLRAPTVVNACAAIASASTTEVVVAAMGHLVVVADLAGTAITWHDFAAPLAAARSTIAGAATTCG
jgi:hypothetical protein